MQFRFTEEQKLISESARGAVERVSAQPSVHDLIDSAPAFHARAWGVLADELGLIGLAVPEIYGGAGLGLVEAAAVQEQIGAHLLPVPYLASAGFATAAIAGCASDAQCRAWLPAMAAGSLIATWAHGRPDTSGEWPRLSGQGRLDGVVSHVLFAGRVGLVLVSADGPSGPCLVAVRPDQAGVRIVPRTGLDLTQPVGDVVLEGVAVGQEQVLPGDAGVIRQALNRARTLLAADLLGGAQASLDLTVSYAKERVQFGRPIGSFQALKHIMADMASELEAARSAVYYAACIADEMPEELAEAAPLALSVTIAAFQKIAGDMIQLHGGIGFTWEHSAHLYFKRAWVGARMLGSRQALLEEIAACLIGRNELVGAA